VYLTTFNERWSYTFAKLRSKPSLNLR